MASNGAQAADFIKVLHATLEAANLTSQVGIGCCESEGWANQVNMLNGIKMTLEGSGFVDERDDIPEDRELIISPCSIADNTLLSSH
jgi:hypothetical protein